MSMLSYLGKQSEPREIAPPLACVFSLAKLASLALVG